MKIHEFINNKNKEYVKNIDILRFFFAGLIVSCNILPSLTGISSQCSIFKFFLNNQYHLWMCVELFFIISGFFFIYTYKPSQSWLDFFKAKIIRLWPVMIFTIIIFAIASIFKLVHLYLMEDIFTLFFLNGLRLANHTTPNQDLGNLHPLWFVSCLIYVSIVYRYIINNYGFKLFNLVLILIIPVGIWIHIDTPAPVYRCYTGTIDVFRAFYGVGLGSLIAILFIENKENFENIQKNILSSFWKRLLVSLVEIGIFFYLMFGLMFSAKDRLVEGDLILLFIFLFLLLLVKGGWLSNILNSNFSVTLGKYSFAIFCTHSFWIDIANKYYFTDDVWNTFKNMVEHNIHTYIHTAAILYVLLPVVLSIIFGILTYYLVEKPGTKYLKQNL